MQREIFKENAVCHCESGQSLNGTDRIPFTSVLEQNSLFTETILEWIVIDFFVVLLCDCWNHQVFMCLVPLSLLGWKVETKCLTELLPNLWENNVSLQIIIDIKVNLVHWQVLIASRLKLIIHFTTDSCKISNVSSE